MSPLQQLRQQTSNCSSLLIYRPQNDERLSWPSWLTYSRWLAHISGHPSATSRAQDSKSTSSFPFLYTSKSSHKKSIYSAFCTHWRPFWILQLPVDRVVWQLVANQFWKSHDLPYYHATFQKGVTKCTIPTSSSPANRNFLPWAVQEWLNLSICHLGCGLR